MKLSQLIESFVISNDEFEDYLNRATEQLVSELSSGKNPRDAVHDLALTFADQHNKSYDAYQRMADSLEARMHTLEMNSPTDMGMGSVDEPEMMSDPMGSMEMNTPASSEMPSDSDMEDYAAVMDNEQEVEESYSPGDENAEGMVSNCCGAPVQDERNGTGRCSACGEGCEAVAEAVEEAVGDPDSVRNIDSILTSMNADHPGDIIADILHWCDAKNEDFNDLIRRGTDYYRDEKEMAGGMDESSMSDEEKEKAMKRAMQSADEPERGEKRKKVSVSKAPWESLEEELEDTFVGINTETGDFESGLSHEEVTSGRFTHMLPDDTTYFDPDTAEELVGAPDEEMEAMGWEKVMSSKSTDSTKTFKTPYGKVDANWDSNAGEFGDFDAEDKQLRNIMMNMADDFGSVDHDNVKAFVQAAMKKRKGMQESNIVKEASDTFVGINTETGDFESGLSSAEVTSGRFTHMLPDDTTYFDPDTAEELVGAPDEEMEAMGWEKVMPKLNDDADRLRKLAGLSVESEELEESSCGCCGNDPCDCASDCGCKTESVNEAPTMDTTQMVIMMKNAGLSEEAIQTKLTEWANSPADASELEQTSHGEAYDFAQNVNLSLKRYLDAQDMKVQVSEHTVENMKSLYESKKNK